MDLFFTPLNTLLSWRIITDGYGYITSKSLLQWLPMLLCGSQSKGVHDRVYMVKTPFWKESKL